MGLLQTLYPPFSFKGNLQYQLKLKSDYATQFYGTVTLIIVLVVVAKILCGTCIIQVSPHSTHE